MDKKLILVASPPACGKTYVSKLLAGAIDQVVYLDKDDLGPIIRRAFAVSGHPVEMDGAFYLENLREAEYDTIMSIAFSALEFNRTVILNAPFGKEVRDEKHMHDIKARANAISAELVLIWVTAPIEVCHERMIARNSSRDAWKLANWQDYVSRTNFTIPTALAETGAVDRMIVFDATDELTTQTSLKNTINTLNHGGKLC